MWFVIIYRSKVYDNSNKKVRTGETEIYCCNVVILYVEWFIII